MDGLCKFLILLLLIISSIFCRGEKIDTVQIRTRANELRLRGGDLYAEGLYYQALDTFKLFLEYRKKIYGTPNYYLGGAYLNIGIIYKNLGEHQLALENFEQAITNYLEREDRESAVIGNVYLNTGNAYRDKLDYKNALNYFEQALAISLAQDPIDPISVSNAYYSIAEINYLTANYNNAIQLLLDNLNKGEKYDQIYYNELLALVYQELDDSKLSIEYYNEVIKLSREEFENTDIELGIIYLNYAAFLLSLNLFDESLDNLIKAFDIIRFSQVFRGEQLSRYYELRGALSKDKTIETQQIDRFKAQKRNNLFVAIDWYKKALNALSTSMSDIDIHSIRIENCISFLDCLALLQQIGDAYYELALIDKESKTNFTKNSLISALDYYSAASRLTQQARREISSDESKIQLAELEYYTFSQTIEIAYQTYELTGENKYIELAFHNSEQLKSSAIFDKISDDIAQENSLIPDSLRQYEKKLNGLISIYNQKIFEENSYQEPDTILIKDYNDKIFEASRERDELNRFLEKEYADYYNLKYSNSMLSIEEIQQKMDKDDAIFEYVIVEPKEESKEKNEVEINSQLYTILITKTNTIFNKSTIDSTLDYSLENYFSFMTNPAYLFTKDEDSKEFCISSHKLYNLLIEPFENLLINKNLIIIPDGKLNYIAFDGLLSNLPDTNKIINFSKLDYLLIDFNINYANSANILFKSRNKSGKMKNSTLAFAPEYNSEKFEMSNASYTLVPLPGVQKEVDAIAKTIQTKIYRGNEATEQNFREKSKKFDILHLAMHAYINDSLPAFSRLAFSPQPDESVLNKDGWLNTTDIYNLELNARLAVLSACNTGVGKLQKGEGMMSLARGFLYAGCSSIIMSLWEVEDESGTQIVTSFYKNLKKGKSKDEALRLAKLSYLKNSNSRLAHPHYWMYFKSIGDNSPIYTSYDIYFFILLIILILAFTIDQSLRIKKARGKK